MDTSLLTQLEIGPPSQRQLAVALVAHEIHDRGGMERVCAELIRHTHAQVRYTVVAAELDAELVPLVERWVRVRVPRRPFPLRFVLFFALAGLALRRQRVDLIHTVGAIVPNNVDLATIHFCHAGFRAASGRWVAVGRPLARRLNSALARCLAIGAERWSYRPGRVQALAAVSRGVLREVTAHYPGLPVHVTPNGVDVSRFHPDPQVREEVRVDEQVDPATCVALFVGGDWEHKGLAPAIEGLAQARAEGADVVLWVVGRGDKARFAALARRLDVEDALTFFGRRGDMERFYRAADLFLLPSSYESFSLVCFEAAACGLPLLIPPISGAGELVGDDEAGIVIDRSAYSITAALQRMSTDRRLRVALGQEARRRACTFTWEAAAAAVVDLYRDQLTSPQEKP